jgi:streptogramin lyase
VADTYHDALRRVDPESGEVETLPEAGVLSEPGGLGVTPEGDLMVCDGADRGACGPFDAGFQLEVRGGGRELTDSYRAALVLPAPAPGR